MTEREAIPWYRRMPLQWPLAGQYALALSLIAVSLLVRWLLGDLLGDGVPFSLTLGLLLPLAFLVQPRPFLAAVVLGWLGALYLFVPAAAAPHLATSRDTLVVGLYTLVLLLAVGAAWLAERAEQTHALGRTARARAEAQLHSNQEMFVDLIENSPFGVYVVDASFRVHLVGRGAQRVFEHVRPLKGRDLGEVLRSVWREPFASEAIGRFRHTLDTGEPYVATETTEHRHDVDAVESYDWRIERITLPDGQWGVLCYFRDISDEVRTRQQIAESEARLRLAQSAAGLGLHDYDVTTGAITWDARTRDLWGVDADVPITFDVWREGLHPDDRPTALARLAAALEPAGGGVYQDEYRVIDRRDGTVRWVEATGHATFDGDRAVRLVGTAQDITARRTAEQSSSFQARLLDEVGQAVVVTDPHGTIVYWNRAAGELYGWTREEAIGRHVLETTVGQEGAAHGDAILEQLRSGRSWSGEFVVDRRGVRRVALVVNTPMTDDEGRLTAIVGVSMDITELKAAQQALEEADRRKDEFLATLAHELRNPLAAIRSAVDVLDHSKGDAARVEAMRTIIGRQSAQLVRLIDDLLDVSRITRGKLELQKRTVDLADVIAHAVDGVGETCLARGLQLCVEPPAEPLVIEADPFRFAQVVSNLLSNACKFTDRGGKVVVTAGREGNSAVVRVRDTGIGMAPADLAQVFEMFAQGSGPAHQRSGLGIGLSLARSIVALHGGTLEAFSEGEGRGSEFVVSVPVVEQADAPATEVAPLAPATAAPLDGRILVVDDNEDILESVALRLRLAGYHVDTASSAADALSAARAQVPAVVLLDIGLPDADGYDVARALRQESWGREVFLVAVTGWGQQKDKRRALDAGFDVHLTKPVDVHALLRLLAERVGSVPSDSA